MSTFFIQLGIWAFPAKNKSDTGTQGGSDKPSNDTQREAILTVPALTRLHKEETTHLIKINNLLFLS